MSEYYHRKATRGFFTNSKWIHTAIHNIVTSKCSIDDVPALISSYNYLCKAYQELTRLLYRCGSSDYRRISRLLDKITEETSIDEYSIMFTREEYNFARTKFYTMLAKLAEETCILPDVYLLCRYEPDPYEDIKRLAEALNAVANFCDVPRLPPSTPRETLLEVAAAFQELCSVCAAPRLLPHAPGRIGKIMYSYRLLRKQHNVSVVSSWSLKRFSEKVEQIMKSAYFCVSAFDNAMEHNELQADSVTRTVNTLRSAYRQIGCVISECASIPQQEMILPYEWRAMISVWMEYRKIINKTIDALHHL